MDNCICYCLIETQKKWSKTDCGIILITLLTRVVKGIISQKND